MNRIFRLFLLGVILACGLSPVAFAQRTIGLVARAQSDKILLRWTPDSSTLWQQANQYGYYVLRRTVARNGVALTGTASVTLNAGGAALKPLLSTDPFWTAVTVDSVYRRSMRDLLYATNPAQPPVDTVDSVNPQAADLPFYRYVNALITADQSFTTAVAAGLGFVDLTALSNERYEYQITTAIPTGVMATTSQMTTVGLADYRPLVPVDKPTVRFGTQTATVSWKADTVATGYNTYWIERSTNGTTFTARNKQAFLVAGQDINAFFYQDSMPKGRRTYYYRLQGKTIFDEVGFSPVVFGQSKDTLLNAAAIKTLRIEPNGAASLSWQFPGDTVVARADTLLKSYFIGVATRAQDRPVPAQIGISATATAASVTNYQAKAPGGSTYYFTVGAVRLDGDTLLSSPVFIEPLDTIPPTVPTGLQGLITAQGMGNLSWRPNPEPDLLGYKVFRSQRSGEEPSAITGDSILISSGWRDPVALDFLNAGVYYQVRAIDRRYNESPLSAPVYLVKPDTIRPTAPLFQRFAVQAGGVRLRWANSFSRDVVRHTLYRRDASGGNWQPLMVFVRRDTISGGQATTISDTAWTDAGAQASRSYTYLLLSEDTGGLLSDSTAKLLVDVPASMGGQKPYFSALSAQSNGDRPAVTLTWSYDAPGVAEYQMYRAVGSRPLGLWRMVSGLETTTDDSEVKPDTTYRYQVRASFRDGTVSNWQSVTITYRDTASANQPPYVALPIPAQQATVGTPFAFTVPAATFADADNGIQSIRIVTNGLPPGIAANGAALSGVPLRAGVYTTTVQATDRRGLAVATSFSITVNGQPTLLTGLPAQTVTVGQSFSYTVPATAFFDGQGSSVQLTIVSTGLPAGLVASGATLSGTLSTPGPFTITVQATDAEGASSTTFFRLSGNRPPQLTASVTAQTATVGVLTRWTLPAGAFVDPEGQPLSAALLANGLPAGIDAQGLGYTGTPTTPGTYSLTVRATDDKGATADAVVTLIVVQAANIAPVVAASLASQTLAVGQPVDFTVSTNTFFDEDGQIATVVLNGTLPPGLSAQGTRLTGIPTAAGSYTLTVTATDDRGASVNTSLLLVVPAPPAAPTVAGATTICAGQSTVLTASNCAGGTIQWSTSTTGSSLTVSPPTTTTYTATCQQNSQASVASNAVVVTVAATPIVSIAGNLTLCPGQSTTLTANGGSLYRWSTGATTASISASTAGAYSVTVSNGSACSVTASTSLTVGGAPTVSITGNLSICTGQSTTLTASGGTIYRWSGPVSATTAVVSTSLTGTYSVTTTNGSGCSAVATAVVTTSTPAAGIGGNPVICSGQSTTLTASGGDTYRWSTGATTATLSVSTTGTYSVTVSIGGSCSATASKTVTSGTNPTVTVTGNLSLCAGQTTALTAGGGTAYRWNTGATTAGISASTAGAYSVTVSNGSSCSATASRSLTVITPPTASIAGPLTLCAGQSITLTASGGTAYRWNTGATTPALSVTAAGTYSVTVSNGSSCSSVVSTTLSLGTSCVIYVNCGGPQITDNLGRVWQQDNAVAPSPFLKSNAGIGGEYITENTTDAPDALFPDQRFAQNQQDQFWAFPVANGTYKVNLYFAETWNGCQTSGCRQNKVYLEGVFFETVDVVVLAGHRKALKRTYTVTVTDGVLNLRVDAIGYSSILNALSILPN